MAPPPELTGLTRVAKASLLNPIDDSHRRFEILHDWDPINDLELWTVGWYYLPTDFVVEEWVALHRTIYERLTPYAGAHLEQFQNGVGIGSYSGWKVGDRFKLNCGTFTSSTGYGPGSNWVDDNQDGVNDLANTHWKDIVSPNTIGLGEWFKLSTYVYRHLTEGVFRVWLNDVLQFDLNKNTTGLGWNRTIGCDPARIAAAGWGTGPSAKGWLSSGWSLYFGPTPALPKSLYLSNVYLSNEPEQPPDPDKGTLTVTATVNGTPVIASVVIAGTTYNTPASVSLIPAQYPITCTYGGVTQVANPTVVAFQNTAVNFEFGTGVNYTLSISSSVGGYTSPATGDHTYLGTDSVTVNAYANVAGYIFDHWVLDGTLAGTVPSITVSMNNASHTLQAVFTLNTYNLSIISSPGGSTNPTGTNAYTAGSVVPVTATPATGYVFTQWILDGNNAGSALTINVTMNANHALGAVFTLITYNLAISNTTGGTTTPSGTQTYNGGDIARVTASAYVGYTFGYWLLDGANAGSTLTISVVMNANHSLQAIFNAPTTIVLNVVAGMGGSVAPSGQLTLTIGQTPQFTATEGTGYDFDHWDLAGSSKGSSPSLILLITADMDGQTLTALFTTEPPPKVTMTLAVNGNGSIDIGTGTQIFNEGDVVKMTAIPQAGETFFGWLLNGVEYSTDNPLNLQVTADLNGKTLTANFTTLIQAGFPLWVVVAGAGVAVGGYFLTRGDKKKSGKKSARR